VTLRNKARNCEIPEHFNVEPLLGNERIQLHWFGYVYRMTYEGLVRQDLLATPRGKRPRGLRTRWCNHISDLSWSRLGVASAKLSEIAVDHEVFRVLLASMKMNK